MAMDSGGDLAVHPAFKGLLEAVARQQHPGGYFCASGVIDWQQPIDHPKKGEDALGSRMLPALWGNARLLCGLVEVMRAFPKDDATAAAARRLGDFYVSMLPRFNDPERIAEYTAGGILEKCHVKFGRDEGCSIVDWFRLNLALARVTNNPRYRAMAERTLHNHLLQNQTSKGGFGHRRTFCDADGAYGFGCGE